MKPVLVILVVLLGLAGCQNASRVQFYRTPGSSTSLRIEVLPRDTIPVRYELQIDGGFVVEFGTNDVIDRPAVMTHKGRRVEIRGLFSRGGIFTVGVFIDAERACSFDFQT